MAYDEVLAQRIRDLIGPDPELTEKRMFGGLAFLIRGHMAISASGQGGVLVHVDPARSDELVAATAATVAVMQGREMPGWLRVAAAGVATDEGLAPWVETGIAHARSLPPKDAARPGKKKALPRRGACPGSLGAARNRRDAVRCARRLAQARPCAGRPAPCHPHRRAWPAQGGRPGAAAALIASPDARRPPGSAKMTGAGLGGRHRAGWRERSRRGMIMPIDDR
jgi:TfoX N-terminal domain